MQAHKNLIKAVMDGTKEIFSGQGFDVTNELPVTALAGEVANQITILLSFNTDISGILCFKCSIEFGGAFCSHLFGDPGYDDEYEILQGTMSELLNWISGGIQRSYVGEPRIDISTPSVFIIEEILPVSQSNEEMTLVWFNYNGHRFSIEIMLDEDKKTY